MTEVEGDVKLGRRNYVLWYYFLLCLYIRETYTWRYSGIQYIIHCCYAEVWILAPDLDPQLPFASWAVYWLITQSVTPTSDWSEFIYLGKDKLRTALRESCVQPVCFSCQKYSFPFPWVLMSWRTVCLKCCFCRKIVLWVRAGAVTTIGVAADQQLSYRSPCPDVTCCHFQFQLASGVLCVSTWFWVFIIRFKALAVITKVIITKWIDKQR